MFHHSESDLIQAHGQEWTSWAELIYLKNSFEALVCVCVCVWPWKAWMDPVDSCIVCVVINEF